MSSPATIFFVVTYLKWSLIITFLETLDDVDGGDGGDSNADVDCGGFNATRDSGNQ